MIIWSFWAGWPWSMFSSSFSSSFAYYCRRHLQWRSRTRHGEHTNCWEVSWCLVFIGAPFRLGDGESLVRFVSWLGIFLWGRCEVYPSFLLIFIVSFFNWSYYHVCVFRWLRQTWCVLVVSVQRLQIFWEVRDNDYRAPLFCCWTPAEKA